MYHLEVFHVERYKCTSEFLFHLSGVDKNNFGKGLPVDFLAHVGEDANVNTIVQLFALSDLYKDRKDFLNVFLVSQAGFLICITLLVVSHGVILSVPPRVNKYIEIEQSGIWAFLRDKSIISFRSNIGDFWGKFLYYNIDNYINTYLLPSSPSRAPLYSHDRFRKH